MKNMKKSRISKQRYNNNLIKMMKIIQQFYHYEPGEPRPPNNYGWIYIYFSIYKDPPPAISLSHLDLPLRSEGGGVSFLPCALKRNKHRSSRANKKKIKNWISNDHIPKSRVTLKDAHGGYVHCIPRRIITWLLRRKISFKGFFSPRYPHF